MPAPPAIRLAPLHSEQDIQRVIALEAASYPADEAATPDKIRYRQQHAGHFFHVARRAATATATATTTATTTASGNDDAAEIIGFVNGTLTAHDELTEETMSRHDPHGSTLCIHSVVVDSALRRQGLAAAMLKQYVRGVIDSQPHVTRIALIAKAYLVGFYIHCGFTVTRLSPVVHGKDPWFELVLDVEAARRLTVVQVDAFSTEIFDGNPAAVVVMPAALYHKEGVATWMQNVGKENNLSETAYVARREPSDSSVANVVDYDLRWFTPGAEVTLCGHATLSSAYVLFEDGEVPAESTIHFHTLSGILKCRQEITDGEKWITMDFPVRDLKPASPELGVEILAEGLGLAVSDFITVKQTITTDALIHVSTDTFAKIVPNIDLLRKANARGIMVTAEKGPNDKGVDFQSRFFGPRVGINEDPVTGSAHCALAAYWSELLNKKKLYAHQDCPLRGGYISIELPEDQPGRVILKGQAVISLRGTLYTSP